MKNKLYVKEGVGFEGITMQSGKSRAPKIFRFVAVLLIVLGLLGFAIAGYMQTKKQPASSTPAVVVLPTSSRDKELFSDQPEATVAVSPVEEEVSPTRIVTLAISPSVVQKKSALTIAVLNGSGTKGAAKEMSTALTAAGYVVSRTGNADAFTYEGISVQIKKSKQQNLDQLKKDLSANNYLVAKSTVDLAETADTDVIVIVGTE